jgi:chromosome partitioning protein
MRTIAIIARKGGSGKSTVAIHLALAAHLRGLSVMVADTDAQRSASHILRNRAQSAPVVVGTSGPKLFPLQIQAQREGFDVLVVDTPAVLEEDLGHAIVTADLCILVVRPTFLDLAAAAQTSDIVRRLRKPLIAVLNQAASPRAGVEPPLVKRSLQALRLLRIPTAPVILRARASYQWAVESGMSVEEADGQREAAAEIAAFWTFVYGLTRQRNAIPAEPVGAVG